MDLLLGNPLQRELAAETGLDVALDALLDVTSCMSPLARLALPQVFENLFQHFTFFCDRFVYSTWPVPLIAAAQAVSVRVQQLLETAREAKEAALLVNDRLQELRGHVDALKRTCPRQERPLCDTLHTAGLHVTLSLDPVSTPRGGSGLAPGLAPGLPPSTAWPDPPPRCAEATAAATSGPALRVTSASSVLIKLVLIRPYFQSRWTEHGAGRAMTASGAQWGRGPRGPGRAALAALAAPRAVGASGRPPRSAQTGSRDHVFLMNIYGPGG